MEEAIIEAGQLRPQARTNTELWLVRAGGNAAYIFNILLISVLIISSLWGVECTLAVIDTGGPVK
eukprot:7826344-Pyramimonas_sp.AAC.1